MRHRWNRRALMQRIDRCYLVAAWTRIDTKRERYIALARQYRAMLEGLSGTGRLALA